MLRHILTRLKGKMKHFMYSGLQSVRSLLELCALCIYFKVYIKGCPKQHNNYIYIYIRIFV